MSAVEIASSVRPSAKDQIVRNLFLADRLTALEGDDRQAGRFLFSVLADLEQIAVLAAERGDGIPGQLEDELAHRDTFAAIADMLGGKTSTPESVQKLTDYLAELSGEASLAVLNVVAEAWLENVFRHVSGWGVADELFQVIAAEEARHSNEAMQLAKPDPRDVGPLVRTLERLLFDVATDPWFTVPLAWFGGVKDAANMGRENVEAHRRACEHLGVPVSHYAGEIGACMWQIMDTEEPDPKPLHASERTAIGHMWPPIGSFIEVKLPRGRTLRDTEVLLTRAVSRALAAEPRLNRTLHEGRGEIFQCRTPVVGVRRLWDKNEMLCTLYQKAPHEHGFDVVLRDLSSKMKRARALPYREIPQYPGLERLFPAPYVAAVVTNTTEMIPGWSYPSLTPNEGVTISISTAYTPTTKKKKRRRVTLGVVVDHRVHNGRELGRVTTLCKQFIESGD